ncbi:MAG: RnfH family protein [Acidiferrobacterales bacterium]
MKINIEIVYAGETSQKLVQLEIDPGTSIAQAIKDSGLLKTYPEIDIKDCQVGIFSKKASIDTILQDQDRVEIYRPLKISPKDARKLRASLARD